MPVDEREMDRMDLQHQKYYLVLNDRHYLAPIHNPQRILDLGTGTGIALQQSRCSHATLMLIHPRHLGTRNSRPLPLRLRNRQRHRPHPTALDSTELRLRNRRCRTTLDVPARLLRLHPFPRLPLRNPRLAAPHPAVPDSP
jgi:hypothetical protein